MDSKSLELMALLRRKSYAMFTPAERMRLLRGLCDLAASTGPIKEHLQVRAFLWMVLGGWFCSREGADGGEPGVLNRVKKWRVLYLNVNITVL